MSEKLQKSPLGWLEFMTLKALGRAPDTISSELRPVIDATEFYGVDRCLFSQEAFAPQTFPIIVNSAVSVQPRRLLALSGSVTYGAAGSTNLVMSLSIVGPNGSSVGVGAHLGSIATAGFVFPIIGHLTKPLVLPAGHYYRLAAYSGAAGADHVATIRALWQRLDPV